MGLILKRKTGEAVIINENTIIRVISCSNGIVKLSCEGPPSVIIDREELHDKKLRGEWNEK